MEDAATTDLTLAAALLQPLDPAARTRLGRTGLDVSLVGLGTGPIGNLYAEVSDEDARATVDAALDAGICHFDTAPLYGAGLSERRLGERLRERPRDGLVVSTKAGFLVRAGDGPGDTAELSLFATPPGRQAVLAPTRDGIRRSLEESLERLGLDRVDVLYLHEPERAPDAAFGEALPALIELRSEGLVREVGVGSGDVALLTRAVRDADVGVVLLAGGRTLLDRSAGRQLLPLAAARGVAVVLGSVLHGGLLVDEAGRFDYPWASGMLERVAAVREIARRHHVSVAAAAIRFGIAGEAVASVLVGARTAAELQANMRALADPVPAGFWHELVERGLLREIDVSAGTEQ